jgi:hypothetical protein
MTTKVMSVPESRLNPWPSVDLPQADKYPSVSSRPGHPKYYQENTRSNRSTAASIFYRRSWEE